MNLSTIMTSAAAGVAGVALAVGVLGVAAPAFAHDNLVSSTPSEGENLTSLPAEFSISTNEGLLDLSGDGSGFALQVIDSDGRYYGDGCLTIADSTMSTPAALGTAGDYTILWQAISTDGHTVSDEFDFTWAPPADFTPATGAAGVPDCGKAPTDVASPAAASDSTMTDALWIGGAILGIAIAAVVAFLLVGRTHRKPKA